MANLSSFIPTGAHGAINEDEYFTLPPINPTAIINVTETVSIVINTDGGGVKVEN